MTPAALASPDALPDSAKNANGEENLNRLKDDAGQELSPQPGSAKRASDSVTLAGQTPSLLNSQQLLWRMRRATGPFRNVSTSESASAALNIALQEFNAFTNDAFETSEIKLCDASDSCVQAFVEHIRSQHLDELTIYRRLRALASTVRRSQVPGPQLEAPNPFKKALPVLNVGGQPPSSTVPFTIDELQQLVSLAAHSERGAARNALRSEVLWTLLLGLFTGMRIRELWSLGVSDVVLEEGCWGLQILSRPRYTRHGPETRFVPLHRELLLCGFLEYVALRTEDEPPLASTHILKPEPGRTVTPHLVVNEHFCRSLAKRIRRPVAAVSIYRTPRPVRH